MSIPNEQEHEYQRVVLASGNEGKLRELQDALSDTRLRLQPQSAFDVPEAIEDKPTFVENALIKARNAATHTGLAAIADDSGLVVPALGGEPGIYSSRYSGTGDAGNNAKLLDAMRDFSGVERAAWFVCVVVFLDGPDDPSPLIAEGRWHGSIAEAAHGAGGFGYDPVFLVDSLGVTAAELSLAQKRSLSHRGEAVAQLRNQLGA